MQMTNLCASMVYAGLLNYSMARPGLFCSIHTYVQAGGPFGVFAGRRL